MNVLRIASLSSTSSGILVPRTVHGNNNNGGGLPQGRVEQKPVTSGSSAGRLNDLMKSLRLHAGEDWE